MIKAGQKIETRRQAGLYKVGRTYSIQPGRRKAGIAEGRIRILKKRKEYSPGNISKEEAWNEGMYMNLEFERLYSELCPGWFLRFAYTFEYVPIENYRQKGLL